jgi:hypothetical protein
LGFYSKRSIDAGPSMLFNCLRRPVFGGGRIK